VRILIAEDETIIRLDLRDLLERAGHEATEDNGFSVRLAFFQYLKPETRIRLLERRRSFLEGRGSDLQRSLQTYKERIDGYTLSLMNHQLASTEADIRWLDDLIQVEQREVRRARTPRVRTARAARTATLGGVAKPQPAITSDIEPEKERA
jgi:hypothetical protein